LSEFQSAQEEWDRIWMQFHKGLARNPGRLYRHQIINRIIRTSIAGRGQSIVDIGCGTGELLSYLAVEFRSQNLLGLDISHVGILKAQENYPNLNFINLILNYCFVHLVTSSSAIVPFGKFTTQLVK
jgi:tRNA G46 methylase TrmB